MNNDLTLVIEFLNSDKGKEWILENQDILISIKNYITDVTPLKKREIKDLVRFFPELTFTGVAYRFISQSNEIKSDLQWKECFDNLSWSKGSKTYKTVLKSLSLRGQNIKIYKAHVIGLD